MQQAADAARCLANQEQASCALVRFWFAGVLDFKPGTVKGIGALEFLGAIGLILPALLDRAPILVPLAASGLTLLMTGAVIMRIHRGETKAALADGLYLVLAAFVAIGRFTLEPFTG